MSPSPLDKFRSSEVRNYHDAWRAVMQLVRSGYSWSGYERNCVFLNCTDPGSVPRFVDISAISGLDFPDDGRSVAVVDWDHDGDLDLWLRNRSAPRLRLMRNLTSHDASDAGSISVRLVGTTCNRDAIGARVELVLKTANSHSQRLVRSVRAGDAFLSQSSKWLHFGLGTGASIEQLIVDWPGGDREQFRGLSPGDRYDLKQGYGQAVRVQRRAPVSLTTKPYATMPPSAAARVVLPGRIALPPVSMRFDDSSANLSFDDVKSPTLITFWTSSCPNCRHELSDFAKNQSKFEKANLRVVAVCLDGLEQTDGVEGQLTSDASEFLQSIEFPFQSAGTDAETVELLNQFQKTLFGQYPGFVVPLSFLVDSQGQVVSIYRGSYSHELFLRDRRLTELDDVKLRTLATPLRGTWITKPATKSQFAEFVGLRMSTFPKAALRYLEIAIKEAESDPVRQRALRERARQLETITMPAP